MKNKAMTYILPSLVVGFWGYIIHRIFAAVSDEDQAPLANQTFTESIWLATEI